MDKKIYKYAAVIILLSLFSVDGYYIYQHGVDLGLAKPALILQVSTNLTAEGTPRVYNVMFEQSSVPFFYKTTDTAPDFPEIDVNARLNKLDAIPASFWASAHSEGEIVEPGVYTLRVFFRPGSEPKKGDILIMPIRIISHTGAIAYKTTAFYEWK